MNFLYAHICYFTIIIFSSNPQIIIDYINLYKFITFGEVKIKIEMKVGNDSGEDGDEVAKTVMMCQVI